jgi:hypothetical protein
MLTFSFIRRPSCTDSIWSIETAIQRHSRNREGGYQKCVLTYFTFCPRNQVSELVHGTEFRSRLVFAMVRYHGHPLHQCR